MKIKEKLMEDHLTNGGVVITFFGDSVTQGYFQSQGEMHTGCDFNGVYHAQLKQMLEAEFPEKPISVINAGIGGDSADHATLRFVRDVVDHKPDFVVICFGLNDVRGTIEMYENALSYFFETLNNLEIEVLFMTPNTLCTKVREDVLTGELLTSAKWYAQAQNDGRMDAIIAAGIACANKYNVPVVDCYGKWKTMQAEGIDTDVFLSNHINHPNQQLHTLFAKALFEKIME